MSIVIICAIMNYIIKKIKDEYTVKSTITVNLNNLTDNEREQLLKLVSKSHTEEKSKVWKPDNDTFYYYINGAGVVSQSVWCNSKIDEHRWISGNVFHTHTDAFFELERRIIIAQIVRYIKENDIEKLNWENRRQDKCILSYDQECDTIVRTITTTQLMNGIYFSNKFNWKKMIEDIGEDRIKKYLFGVERGILMKKQDENFYDFLEKIDKIVKTVLIIALILFGYAVLETILNAISNAIH